MPFSNDELKQKLLERTPAISRNYLLDYLYVPKQPWEKNLALPKLILEVLRKIPKNGRMRHNKHRFALQAVSQLLPEIQPDDPDLPEVMKLYQERLTWYNQFR